MNELIQELLDREPFQAFRIVTSSGSRFDVKHPELVVLMKNQVFYAFPKSDRFIFIPLGQISEVEGLQTVK